VQVASELVTLPADARAAGLARAAVRERLRGWGMDDLVDVVMLLSSELVTNALLHTNSSPRLGLVREGADVRLTVVDDSPVAPLRRQHGLTAMTGRGLELLEKLADDWGWTSDDGGKAVWALVRGTLPTPAPAHEHEEHLTDRPEETPSPLGRYVPAGGEHAVPVCLLGLPVRVFVAAQDHHDGLLREFRLLAMSDDRPAGPPELTHLVELFGVRFASAGRRPDVEAALEDGQDRIDLEFPVSPAAVATAHELAALLEQADDLCRAGLLVSLPRPRVVREFGRWYLHQLVDQAAGGSPSPWRGPLDPD
jgi:anti-sigma regulatory factor (Ser/Thr protein kinase)